MDDDPRYAELQHRLLESHEEIERLRQQAQEAEQQAQENERLRQQAQEAERRAQAQENERLRQQAQEAERRAQAAEQQAQENERLGQQQAQKFKDKARKSKKRAHMVDYHQSIDEMLSIFDGIPDMPENRYQKPHENESYSARFSVDESLVSEQDLHFKINTKQKVEGETYRIKSFLTNRAISPQGDGLSYQNEASVALYVQDVVRMCLNTLGILHKCLVFQEMTFFSLRPDVVVVEYDEKRIVLVIEVKMPGKKLFESKKIAGQVASYLLLQYRLGNQVPFVLLSSYREACLCCLSGETSLTLRGTKRGKVSDLDNRSVHKGIVQKASKMLRSKKSDSFSSSNGELNDQLPEKPKVSPTKPAFGGIHNIPESPLSPRIDQHTGRKRKPAPNIEVIEPHVVYSKPFNCQNMMHGVLLSIACGFQSLKESAKKKGKEISTLWPEQGETLGELHPKVSKTELVWVKATDLSIDYMIAPKPNENQFIIIREIGTGKNGRVLLAVDTLGNACALKFYDHHIDAEGSHETETFKAALEQCFEERKRLVQQEAVRWEVLQNRYSKYVCWIELNKLNVLRMPVFAPIPTESRLSILPQVREKLLEFFKGGFVYKEIRWQHVGCRLLAKGAQQKPGVPSAESKTPLEIVMLDLESLVEKGSQAKAIIDEQIACLKERAGTDPATGPTSSLGLA